MSKRYLMANFSDISVQRCPCGHVRRAFIDDPEKIASVHLLEIAEDSRVHYHQKTTEIYVVLDGEGTMDLDGQSVSLRSGMTVMIKPFCRHRAVGKLKIINVPIPAFDPKDEYFD